MMMKSLLTLLASVSVLVAAAQVARDLSAFDALAVNEGIHAEVRQADAHRLEVTGDAEALRALEIENEDGALSLGFEEGAARRLSDRQRSSVRATVYTQALKRVVANGGAVVESEHTWATDDFRVVANGGGDVRLALRAREDVRVVANGGADVLLTGEARGLNLVVNGGAEVDATGLDCGEVEVVANGGGEAGVRAARRLKVRANGGAEVKYVGDVPADGVDVRSNGQSEVTRG